MINLSLNNISQSKGLFAGLLLFFSTLLSAQSQFNVPVREAVRTQQVVEYQNYYYSVGQFYIPAINYFGVNLLKLDSLGNLVKEVRLIDSTSIFYPANHISLEKTLDGNFITIFNEEAYPRINGILKFNSNLDTLERFIPVKDSSILLFMQVKELQDTGLIITGYEFSNNRYNALLIRTDKDGTMSWKKVFKEPITSPDTFSLYIHHIYVAPDGGFLLAGWKVYLHDPNTRDPLLMRTDSAGNLLWKKAYGDSTQIDGLACAAYRDDGNIMLYYTQGTHPLQQAYSYQPVFSIIDDQDGHVIQKKTYLFIDRRNMYSYQLIKDKNKFIAAGQINLHDSTIHGGTIQGYTLAIDKNLNDLWLHYYSAQGPSAPLDDWSALYDLQPTSDGGYVGGGYLFTDDTTISNVHPGYNGWVIKMDSMGCATQNCVNRISLPENNLPKPAHKLSVYPNPSRGSFTIEIPGQRNAIAVLYDLSGAKLQEGKVVKGKAVLNTTKNKLPPGIYLIRVTDTSGFTATAKVSIN